MVETQFAGTEYVERMKRSVEGMNRMSVSEQLTHFFEGIDMPVGKKRRRRCKHEIFLRTVYMLEIVLITKNSL